jgi:transposase
MSEQLVLFNLPNNAQKPKASENINGFGKPRLNVPIRNQVVIRLTSIEDLLPMNHQVRNVWAYVSKLNLSLILTKIKSVEGNVGRPATDPRLLLSLWLYATIEGIGSARVIERYCSEHIAFQWLCGDVKINYHTISDFRSDHGEALENLLTQSVATLMKQDLVSLNRVSQDGVKVRANAGRSSFRREQTLKELLAEAKEQVDNLKKEMEEDPSKNLSRLEAGKKRAVEEREAKVEAAIKELENVKEEINKNAARDTKNEIKKKSKMQEHQQRILKQEK